MNFLLVMKTFYSFSNFQICNSVINYQYPFYLGASSMDSQQKPGCKGTPYLLMLLLLLLLSCFSRVRLCVTP